MLEFNIMSEQDHRSSFLLDVLEFSQSAVVQPQGSLRLQRPLVPAHQLKRLFAGAVVQQMSSLGFSFESCRPTPCSRSIFLPPSSISQRK